MLSASMTLWYIPASDSLVWHDWDSDFTIFDRSTGQTHLINLLPGELLKKISGPSRSEQLAQDLASLCQVGNTPDWHQKILGILAELKAIGLVQEMTA